MSASTAAAGDAAVELMDADVIVRIIEESKSPASPGAGALFNPLDAVPPDATSPATPAAGAATTPPLWRSTSHSDHSASPPSQSTMTRSSSEPSMLPTHHQVNLEAGLAVELMPQCVPIDQDEDDPQWPLLDNLRQWRAQLAATTAAVAGNAVSALLLPSASEAVSPGSRSPHGHTPTFYCQLCLCNKALGTSHSYTLPCGHTFCINSDDCPGLDGFAASKVRAGRPQTFHRPLTTFHGLP